MITAALKQELNTYIPLLSARQQTLVLDMVKNILNVDPSEQRISVKQYNKEIAEAEKQIASGNFTTKEDLEKEMQKWWKKEYIKSFGRIPPKTNWEIFINTSKGMLR